MCQHVLKYSNRLLYIVDYSILEIVTLFHTRRMLNMGDAKRRKDLGMYPDKTKKPDKPARKKINPHDAALQILNRLMRGYYR
jgi:hypothetical protein